jgi:uncharacterized protein (TIGR03067 family)
MDQTITRGVGGKRRGLTKGKYGWRMHAGACDNGPAWPRVRRFAGVLMRIRILAIGMTALLFPSSHGTADEKEKAAQKELARMQGIWCRGLALEFGHRNGGQEESRPLDELVKSHRIQGNKWISYDFKGKITNVEKTITLDVSSNPKKIQLTTTRKGRDGKPDVTFTEYGIYQLNGDSLKVHYGLEDPKGGTKPGPKQFLQAGKLVKGVEGFAIGYTRIKK